MVGDVLKFIVDTVAHQSDVSPMTMDTSHDQNASDTSYTPQGLQFQNTPSIPSTCHKIPDKMFEEGYDSDGLLPCYEDSIEEMNALDKYNDVQVGADEDTTTKPTPITDDNIAPSFVFISNDDIKKLLVDGLKKELKARGLGISGRKVELVSRLQQAMVDRIPLVSISGNEVAPSNLFSPGATWVRLTPLAETLDDPNEGTEFHAPTEVEGVATRVKKRNFGQSFDRPQFSGTMDVLVLDRYKRVKID